MALSEDYTAIVASDQVIGSEEGSAFIFDNYSVLPPTPLEITFEHIDSLLGVTTWDPHYSMAFIYTIGRNREFQDLFFMSDCTSEYASLCMV